MAYTPKHPRFSTTTLTDQGVSAVANPASGSHTLIDRSGAVYVRDSGGIETQLLTGASATQYSAKSADYTILDNDNIRTVGMTTSSTDRTVTLPTAADNTHRIITVKKVDSGTGKVTIDGEGSETIDGALTFVLTAQYDSVTMQCSGTDWKVIVHDRVASMRVSWSGTSLGTSVALFNSLSLTTGIWLLRLVGKCDAGSATRVLMSISTSSSALDATMYGETLADVNQKLSAGYNMYALSRIVNLAAATQYHAVGQSQGASSTLHDGLFEAVRIA